MQPTNDDMGGLVEEEGKLESRRDFCARMGPQLAGIVPLEGVGAYDPCRAYK